MKMPRRYTHNLSYQNLTSGSFGELLPIGAMDVLPGDTFRYMPSVMFRLPPLNYPPFADLEIGIHTFFVPNRLLWKGWEGFITGRIPATGTGGQAPPFKEFGTVSNSDGFNRMANYMGMTPLEGARVDAIHF